MHRARVFTHISVLCRIDNKNINETTPCFDILLFCHPRRNGCNNYYLYNFFLLLRCFPINRSAGRFLLLLLPLPKSHFSPTPNLWNRPPSQVSLLQRSSVARGCDYEGEGGGRGNGGFDNIFTTLASSMGRRGRLPWKSKNGRENHSIKKLIMPE